MENDFRKDKDMLCGPACLYYIYKKLDINADNLNFKIEFIGELVTDLILRTEFDIKLCCYKSALFGGVEKIQPVSLQIEQLKFLKAKKVAIKKRLSALKSEIKKFKFVICCVDSAKFNEKPNMIGCHFIIALNLASKIDVEIVNPLKETYKKTIIDINKLYSCMKNCGGWRILIK